MKVDALILLSRGGYSSAPQEQLAAMVATVQAKRPDLSVVAAFVDQGEPGLQSALETLALASKRNILVLPVCVPSDRNLERWLSKVIARWHAAWLAGALDDAPRAHVTVHMAIAFAQHTAMGEAIASALESLEIDRADVAANPPAEWQKDPEGWSEVPAHTYHLLLCRGPRCTANGADSLWTVLHQRAREEKIVYQNTLTVSTGCLFPCNLGPLLVVHPDGVWYGNLTEESVGRIVHEHLANGQVVTECVVHTNGIGAAGG